MRVYTTETYLRNHLAHLRQRLLDEFGANPTKVATIDQHLTHDEEKGMTQYALRMHREWHMLSDRASQLVSYVEVPEARRVQAEALVHEYLTTFASVVAPAS